MKSKKNIVLVGMMGAGKSSIGKLLSKKIGFDFVDIDKLIEEKEDKTIVEIFKINGEKYFRDLEEKISIEKLKNTNQVIALGGGAYLNRNIRKQTLDKSTSFWLNWNSSMLINRIKANKKRIKHLLENSLMLVTALAPKIGYDKAANIAKTAHKNGTTLKYEVIKSGLISEREYDKIMSPIKMTKPK